VQRWARLGLVRVLAACLLGAPAPSPAELPPYIVSDHAGAVAVDQVGHPLLAGVRKRRPGEEPGCDFYLAKLSTAGRVDWRIDRPDCRIEITTAPAIGEQVFVDPAGDVVVGKQATLDYEVLKVSGTGAVLWSQRFGELPKNGPWAYVTALDREGSVIVAGGFRPPDAKTIITDLVVAKLDGEHGHERWRRTFRGTFPGTREDEAYNEPWGIAVDAKGDVIASGRLVNGGPGAYRLNSRWTVVKLAGDTGATRWRYDGGQAYGATGGIHPRPQLVVDRHGDILAVATTRMPSPGDYAIVVVKLSGATGLEIWRRRLAGYALGGTILAATAEGDVAVAGIVQNVGPGQSIVVGVLEGGGGRERWRRVIHGSADDATYPGVLSSHVDDVPAALAVDPGGALLVGGLLRNAETGTDFAVLSLDAETGCERWRRTIDGSAHGVDGARSLAVLGDEVIVVGEVENVGTGTDALAVALAAASGDERWRLVCHDTDCRPEDPSPAAAETSGTCIGGGEPGDPLPTCASDAVVTSAERHWRRARRLIARARRERVATTALRLRHEAADSIRRARTVVERAGASGTIDAGCVAMLAGFLDDALAALR
jgi:outer membrane protein assembly factor BamB